MEIKKYQAKRDYKRILNFLANCYKENKDMTCWLPERFDDLVTRIDALYHDTRGGERSADYIYIFEDEKDICACILPDGDCFNASVKRGYEYLFPQMLSLAESEMKPLFKIKDNGKIDFLVCVNEKQISFVEHLIKNGYIKQDDLQYNNMQNPQLFDGKIDLPKGFKIVYGEDIPDERYKNWTCSVGFHPEQELDKSFNESMDMHSYVARKKTVCFKDSFECMSITEDGELCSYAFCYVNKKEKTAYIEPVSTREKFRRLGLGKAMLLGIVKRCKELGITDCWVGSYADHRKKLYNSAGFKTNGAESFWVKEI